LNRFKVKTAKKKKRSFYLAFSNKKLSSSYLIDFITLVDSEVPSALIALWINIPLSGSLESFAP
jgi:hypothetical protein